MKRRNIPVVAENVRKQIVNPQKTEESVRFEKVVSTGSTLLDLAISGGRVRGGGIPGGIYLEIFGPESWGKTALLAEIAGSTLARGGKVHFTDPEGRFDREYAEKIGIHIPVECYSILRRVEELKPAFEAWMPEDNGEINGFFVDSIAALSSEWEEKNKDEMGMRKAKMLHRFFRTNKTLIGQRNWIIAFTNQIIDGSSGETTPGGKAAKFWSSVRIRLGPHPTGKYIKKKKTIMFGEKKKEIEKVVGVRVNALVKKNSVDEGFRSADISIIYGYGVDDLRENLIYIKSITGSSVYNCGDGVTKRGIDQAIQYVEENGLVEKIREKTIDLWEQVEREFSVDRKRKQR